ncbi:MAG: ADP-ribosylglycohydrolase family protein, partial [Cyanobacteria bacterium]|nr:ADP-ribosylglycohydrolase family protein [Cyanobacteriota bacterium]
MTDLANKTKLDKYLGCLLGLACGDALGTTLEFTHPGSFHPISDMTGGGPFDLEAGQWTDDTSMALCLADSLIACEDFDAEDQMERYVRWWQKGYLSSTGCCFDIGNTTKEALSRFIQTGNPYSGSNARSTQGNGSIMRLAPIPMFYVRDPAEAIEKSGQSSMTTHAANSCIDACRYLGALIVGALSGAEKETLLSDHYSPVENYFSAHPLDERIDAIVAGSFKHKNPPAIKGSGFVVDSLEAALWAFHTSSNFEEGCLRAVNLGDDADTTGAVFGQLAGAYYGKQGIPSHWLET